MKRTMGWVVLAGLGVTAAGLAGEVRLVTKPEPSQLSKTAAGDSVVACAPSDDGRYVPFVSAASNLVPGQNDPNGGNDVFLRDRIAGTTTLISRSTTSPIATGNAPSGSPVISGDGRYIAFASSATNLVESQPTSSQGTAVYLFDRVSGAVTLVTHVAGAATQANGNSDPRALSPEP